VQDALTVAVQSMHNDLARVEGTSLNLANITTAGYKRGVPVTQSFTDYLSAVGYAGGPRLPLPVTLPSVRQTLDYKAGSLKFTGNALELAIAGNAYFEVSTPSGPAYTRKGNFRLDERGRVVTEQGYPLMGQGGELVLMTSEPAIDRTGQVTDGDKAIGQLRLAQFSNAQGLAKLDSGLYQQGSAQPAPLEGDNSVHQGYLENSNVDSAAEMVRLIETMRHFEAAQKIVQGYDDMLEKSIRKLGEL